MSISSSYARHTLTQVPAVDRRRRHGPNSWHPASSAAILRSSPDGPFAQECEGQTMRATRLRPLVRPETALEQPHRTSTARKLPAATAKHG